uniref:C2 NT-type domain-containing protein n=1 Tax=Panagrellus redivivus TaxID=6233 RepID=A0A7E4VEN9_PANRE
MQCLGCIAWSWREFVFEHDPMAFLRKKRVKFLVEFEVNRLTDVTFVNAVLFAKVRLLDGGNFKSFTNHGHTRNHIVQLGPRFSFPVKIPADAQTGQLETCRCKVSIRREDRDGSPVKVGYVVVNLSEFAASGSNELKQSYLLDGYTGRQRQDNSRVHIHVKMVHQGTDPMFKVPNLAITFSDEAQLNPADRKAPSRTGALAIGLDDASSPREKVAESFNLSKPVQPVQAMERSSWHGGDHQCTSTSTASSATNSSVTSQSDALPPVPSIPSSSPISDRTSAPPGSSAFSSSNPSTSTAVAAAKHSIRRMSDDRLSTMINRVQRTRHDAQDVIDEVLAESSLQTRTRSNTTDDSDEDRNGLALFVGKDGEAVVGQNSMCSPTTTLQRVHIGDVSLNNL